MMYPLRAGVLSFEKGNEFQIVDTMDKAVVDCLNCVALWVKLFNEVP
jgi:hypothetical protein